MKEILPSTVSPDNYLVVEKSESPHSIRFTIVYGEERMVINVSFEDLVCAVVKLFHKEIK